MARTQECEIYSRAPDFFRDQARARGQPLIASGSKGSKPLESACPNELFSKVDSLARGLVVFGRRLGRLRARLFLPALAVLATLSLAPTTAAATAPIATVAAMSAVI